MLNVHRLNSTVTAHMTVHDEQECRSVLLSLSSCAALCTVGSSVQTVALFPGSRNESVQTGAYTHKLLVQSWNSRVWLCLADLFARMHCEQIDQVPSVLELVDSLKHDKILWLNSHCVYCL